MAQYCVQDFPLARLHFVSTADHDLELPRFTGSMLRGAFGHALKKLVCVTGLDDCHRCPLHRSCAYPQMFEPPPSAHAGRAYAKIPVPYVVEPPPFDHARHYEASQKFEFSMVLIGPALSRLDLIISAWRKALSTGLGASRAKLTLQQVVDESGHAIYTRQQGMLSNQPVLYAPEPQPEPAAGLTLEFHTPLSLRRQGKELDCDTIDTYSLLMSLARRTTNITTLLLGCEQLPDYYQLAEQAKSIDAQKQLQWCTWHRKSSRQNKTMRIGGVIGRWHLNGPLGQFWPFIHLGQWLHVGKKCSFGLGRYTIC